jgi:TonB family protein
MTFNKDNAFALTVTLIIHAIIILLLIIFGMKSIKPEGEEGLFVNFGNIEESTGQFEPQTIEETQQPASTPEVEEVKTVKAEELITQDIEKSVALAEQKKQKELEQKKVEAERIRKEQERKAAEIRKQTASVFSKSAGSNATSQGTGTTGTGNQGSLNGSPESSNTQGGGQGYGNFSLSGRSISGSLPRPSYTIQEEGIVVVQIVVNPRGSVISAGISLQGTNTDNPTLRTAALNAAKQARFNAIDGNQNQSGTITYQYRLR